MKKTLAVLVTLALVASAAFGEIIWSGSGRAVFVPFGIRGANDDIDVPATTYFGVDNPWDSNGPRIGVAVEGKREEGNMGFRVALNLENFSKGINPIDDQAANVWIKPFGGVFETLKFTLGMYQIDNLRFNHSGAGSSFHNYVMYIRGDLTNEEDTFARFHGQGFSGHLGWEPIENLYIGAGFGSTGDTRSFAGEFKEDGWVNTLKNVQVGLGYTIPDIGLFRLQYLGPRPGPDDVAIDKPNTKVAANENGKFQAAFNLKAIKNVDLDVGISIPFVDERTDDVKNQNDMVGSVFVDVNTRPFRLWGLASAKFGGYTETAGTELQNGTDISVMLTPMFYIANDLILLADIFIDSRAGSDRSPWKLNSDDKIVGATGGDDDPTVNVTDADVKNNYFDFGAGLYIRKNIPGGDVRAGVTAKLPGGEAHEGAKPQIFIPIMFNYNF